MRIGLSLSVRRRHALCSKVSTAVAAILGSAALASSVAAAADQSSTGPSPSTGTDNSTTSASSLELDEVTVTAQRRSERAQDVPISIQALTGETLQELNVSTFDDYIKYLPNVTSANNGPGQSEIFMRGLSAGSQPSQGSASTGLWPNVAIYLDNQSGQLPNRNLDIYAADLNRIEVLEGPQGTLFGSGAEAGVIRYITNEPKLDVTEGNVKAGYGVTAHGDPNTELQGVFNLPIISDTLAARLVIYDDQRGGYINNVPATFTRKDTDIGIHYAQYPATNGVCPDMPNVQQNVTYCVPPGSPSINNFNNTGNAINPVTYQGARAEILYKINDDWDFLLSQSYQDMNSQGVFYQQPNASDGAALSRLEVTAFNNAFDKDQFESTSWTLNGKIGPLKAVYTGGYLVRKVEQVGDYTNYARGVYADYYQCYGPTTANPTLVSTCYSPSATWFENERNTHQQHEFRVSTPDDWRLRAIGGVYWEDNKLWDVTGWNYKTVPSCTATNDSGCFSDVGTAPGTTVQNPGIQGHNTSFYQDAMRETKQTAFFASADFDIIPKVLTLTAGTRHFRFENSSVGSVSGSFYCFESGASSTGCLNDNYNLNSQNLRDTESGFKSRGNITWHITPDIMVYYTYSAGFPSGRLQPERRYPACLWHRRRVPVPDPKLVSVRQAHQQRDRLEDRVLRAPPAVERCHLSRELGQRPGGLLRPGPGGQYFLQHQRSEFPGQGLGDLPGGPRHERLDLAGIGLVEPQPADQFAGPAGQQPGEQQLRQTDHPGLRQHRLQLFGHHQPRSGPGRFPERQCAAVASCQPARPLRVGHRELPALHTGRGFPHRSLLHPGGLEPHHRPGRCLHRTSAVRGPCVHHRRCFRGCVERQLVFQHLLRQPHQLERCHVREHRPVHRRSDSAAAARDRRPVRV